MQGYEEKDNQHPVSLVTYNHCGVPVSESRTYLYTIAKVGVPRLNGSNVALSHESWVRPVSS
jgi:hypothetical protein